MPTLQMQKLKSRELSNMPKVRHEAAEVRASWEIPFLRPAPLGRAAYELNSAKASL